MLEKAIASNEYRKYIQENNIQLSDWDLATLIYNNEILYHDEKMRTLMELKNKTSDEKLATQIKERLAKDEVDFHEFCTKRENAYYVLKVWDENDYKMYGVYLTYQAALDEGINECAKFCISKHCYDCQELCKNNKGVFGTVEFNADGTMGPYFGLYIYGLDENMGEVNTEKFEERSLDLPLFFRTGDIVRIIGTNIYGIVVAPDNDEDAKKMQKFAANGDYSDFQVPVKQVYDGEKYLKIHSHAHVPPSLLERATFEEGDKRKGFLEYLVKNTYCSSVFNKTGRDKSRIPEVLSKVEEVWKQYPDLRLGQLLLNVCGQKDLFSIEDEGLVKCLENTKWG